MSAKAALRHLVARIAPVAPATGSVRVLMYHAIDEPDAHDRMALCVPRGRFREQMTVLRDEGYEVVPLADVFQPPRAGGRSRVAITFDDGYRSQAWAAELLRGMGFAATIFVVPRLLDGVTDPARYWERWEHFGWADAAALSRDGVEIGAHSTTHPDLRRCSDDQLDVEIRGARERLEAELGRPVASFSYPFGRHDARVRAAVARAGYQLACTSRYGANRVPPSAFSVERTEVTGTDSLDDFRWKLEGKYDWLAYWQDVASA